MSLGPSVQRELRRRPVDLVAQRGHAGQDRPDLGREVSTRFGKHVVPDRAVDGELATNGARHLRVAARADYTWVRRPLKVV